MIEESVGFEVESPPSSFPRLCMVSEPFGDFFHARSLFGDFHGEVFEFSAFCGDFEAEAPEEESRAVHRGSFVRVNERVEADDRIGQRRGLLLRGRELPPSEEPPPRASRRALKKAAVADSG